MPSSEDRGSGIAAYLEAGTKRVFACAYDWPGWCRSGRDEAAALAALATAAPRYSLVARAAGVVFPAPASATLRVVERLPGSATTDFGAPGAIASRDLEPMSVEEAARQSALLAAAWAGFDGVVAAAPAELRKGPRGGGRDRDAMVGHVLSAEVAYARRLGLRCEQPAPGDRLAVVALRRAIAEGLFSAGGDEPASGARWPARYAVRRIAWHVLDHAWELEDRGAGQAPVHWSRPA